MALRLGRVVLAAAEGLLPRPGAGTPGLERNFGLSQSWNTVIVERWWKVPLAAEGRSPRLRRRHRVYRLVEDTQHQPQGTMELILTQTVEGNLLSLKRVGVSSIYRIPEPESEFQDKYPAESPLGDILWAVEKKELKNSFFLGFYSSKNSLGIRGDTVTVKKSLGRNKLLPGGLAVYPSPENKEMFEAENQLRQEGKLEKLQTKTGVTTVKFLKKCHLEVGMKNNVKWELNPDIVSRHFFRNLGVVVSPHALKLPEEPITKWGEYWCEVTVNGLDTVRVPMSVVNFEKPKTKRYKHWLAQQAAK